MAVAIEPPTTAASPALRTGYILNPRSDLFWFLGLPFLAIAAGLAAQQWLPAVAVASVYLWISVPHHYATWLRTFGFSDEWKRFKDQLIIGPIVIGGLTMLGIWYAPLSLLLVSFLWDLQHSLMQQHGFARIYDFKAGTGSKSTRHWDLALNWILFGNLLINAPLFNKFAIRELYRFGITISIDGFRTVQTVSWTITGIFLACYVVHVLWSVGRGHAINPIKYAFLGSSYFLWYFVSWRTASLMVYTVAHTTMHGLQYMVIVYWYMRRKVERSGVTTGLMSALTRPANVWAFIAIGVLYAVAFQIIAAKPLDSFGFGIIKFMTGLPEIPEHGIAKMSQQAGYELFALVVIRSIGMVHFYYDSFIWKVRDTKTQRGL